MTDVELRTLERSAKDDPEAEKRLEHLLNRLAAAGDLTSLAKLFQLRRKRDKTSYGITRLVHRFIENQAPSQAYTGHHDETEFRVRLEYGGSLVFLYQDGKLVVSGGYLPGYKYRRTLEKLPKYFEVVELEQMPEGMRYSISRYDGPSVQGVVIDMDNDLGAFGKIQTLIDHHFCRENSNG